MRLFAALLASLMFLPGQAWAQVDPGIIKAMLGTYLVAGNDGKPGCRITLEGARAAGNLPNGAMVAKPASACATTLPRLADTIAWEPDGGVKLYDGTRHEVMSFFEDETTLLKTDATRQPQYFMVQVPDAVDRAPHPPALLGPWSLQRENGKPICRVTLGEKLPGDSDTYKLALDPACDPAIKKLKLNSWRVEDFNLMLYGQDGNGETNLTFEPASPTRFTKTAPAEGRTLFLVRG